MREWSISCSLKGSKVWSGHPSRAYSCSFSPRVQHTGIQWEICGRSTPNSSSSSSSSSSSKASPSSLLFSWQSRCWSRRLGPVVTGCCRPCLHVSVRQALPDLSNAGGLPAPRRGPPLHHIPSNYWHPAAFEHTGIIVKNSRGQTADGEGWKQQSLSKRERKRNGGKKSEKLFVSLMPP